MNELDFNMVAIGRLFTPWHTLEDMPIQPTGAGGTVGRLEVFEEFAGGLKDIEGFSHVMVLYVLHRVDDWQAEVVPFMDSQPRGVFATRVPRRPNRIGISTLRLLGREGSVLVVGDVDMLDGSPVLDIKPFYERFDNRLGTRSGWLEAQNNRELEAVRSDDRFV